MAVVKWGDQGRGGARARRGGRKGEERREARGEEEVVEQVAACEQQNERTGGRGERGRAKRSDWRAKGRFPEQP